MTGARSSVGDAETTHHGAVVFLPHRLNRQPVVVRGLTADELWITAGLSGVAGLVAGIPLAFLTRSIATAPTLIVVAIAAGIFIGGGIVRRKKRGRPDTWVYRQIQWRVRLRLPALGGWLRANHLITRNGYWTTHRTPHGRSP